MTVTSDTQHVVATANTDVMTAFFDQHPEIKLVNVQYVTICGIVSSRIMPKQGFLDALAQRGGMHQSVLDFHWPVDGSINPANFAFFCQERGVIKPDLSTLKVYADPAGLRNTAFIIAEGTLFDLDPRANLRRLVKEAKEKEKLEFLMGFEIEVAYLKPLPQESFSRAADCLPGLNLSSATVRSELWPAVNETTVALADAGILVESSHKEYGPSQWEYVLPPFSPVASVDAYVYSVETIKNIARKHGLVATVFPVPYPNNGSTPEAEGGAAQKTEEQQANVSRQKNGQHIHFSAKLNGDDGRSESSAWNPDELLAGILSHIPALCAVGLSQIDSYERVGEMGLCTGGYVGWGEHHRDLPVRRMYKNHWEVRIHDGTSNAYAMAAGIIGAALDRKPLTIGAAPTLTGFLSEEQRTGLGITKQLPKTFQEALTEVEADQTWIEGALGKEYVKWFLALKKGESDAVGKMSVRERRTMLLQHF